MLGRCIGCLALCHLLLVSYANAAYWTNQASPDWNWVEVDGFGWMYVSSESEWGYHPNMGYLYCSSGAESSGWFWFAGNWFWSGVEAFPHVWQWGENHWLLSREEASFRYYSESAGSPRSWSELKLTYWWQNLEPIPDELRRVVYRRQFSRDVLISVDSLIEGIQAAISSGEWNWTYRFATQGEAVVQYLQSTTGHEVLMRDLPKFDYLFYIMLRQGFAVHDDGIFLSGGWMEHRYRNGGTVMSYIWTEDQYSIQLPDGSNFLLAWFQANN